MGKITFRADDDLVDELEAFDASKSEVMRDALRAYLDGRATESPPSSGSSRPESAQGAGADGPRTASDDPRAGTIDDLVRERVDEVLERRLSGRPGGESQDVNVTISLEGAEERGQPTGTAASIDRQSDSRERPSDDVRDGTEASGPRLEGPDSVPTASGDVGGRSCGRCGETIDGNHVYCPNCGEKAAKRVFCECGDEVRSDWSFCPGCGRRTPAADVLDSR